MASPMTYIAFGLNDHRLRRCAWLSLGRSARGALLAPYTEAAMRAARQLACDYADVGDVREVIDEACAR